MKPSDIAICEPTPLTATFGLTEAEQMAAVMILVMVEHGDTWGTVTHEQIGAFFEAMKAAKERGEKIPTWIDSPFFRPSMPELIERGFVSEVETRSWQFTEKAREALRTSSWNRARKDDKSPEPFIRELPRPDELAAQNVEIARVWLAGPKDEQLQLVMILDPSALAVPDDPDAGTGTWGVALADMARHVAHAICDAHGTDVGIALSNIKRFFDAEIVSDTEVDAGKAGEGGNRH